LLSKTKRLKKYGRYLIIFAGIIFFAAIGIRYYRRTVVEIFTDSTGIVWRVLTTDENGNRLIITEHVHGMTQYNTTNTYTFLTQSNGLQPALSEWFTENLAPELRAVALPAENVDNDVRTEPMPIDGRERAQANMDFRTENAAAGFTRAGYGMATPENSLYILSVSEVNEFRRRGSLNKEGYIYIHYRNTNLPTSWWLRSPGVCELSTVAIVWWHASDRIWFFEAVSANERFGFRPALWIQSPQ